ncbi:MAG: HAD-IA family hydrolase [Verrucomicrobiota bacterium]|nr:HAD-IA family hydrolase [Verrucomicrobiota bacterium]
MIKLDTSSHNTENMNKPYKAVLFDLDGTLADNFTAIHHACVHAMKGVGEQPASYERVLRTVGGSIVVTMERLVGREKAPEGIRLFRDYMQSNWSEGLVLLPGAHALVSTLHRRGVITAVFTNKDGRLARAICEHLNINQYLALVIGEGDTPYRKPMPEFTRHLLGQLGMEPSECCMIGDSPFDIQAAACVGMDSYVVATGSHTMDDLLKEKANGVYKAIPALACGVFGLKSE